MCGFLAITGKLRDRVSDEEAQKLLHHRGPDDFQVYRDEDITLYFARLAIIDPSGPGQPSVSECGRYISVFNGEIYNYKTLQKHLNEKGISLKSKGDAEVLPNLFSLYGQDFVEKLEGMFAIAIWDREAKKLSIFRDRIGIKPLYYTSNKDGFACGSEIKPLRLLTGESFGLKGLEEESLEDYLAFGYLPFEKTIFKKINKLPAGFKAYWNGDFSKAQYWSPKNRPNSEESIEKLLQQVTDEHLVSDVPVGIFLSGGFDSSLIGAMAAERSPKMKAYTIKFKDGGLDESHAASDVAKKFNLDHEIVETTVSELVEYLPHIFWASDEPNSDSGIMPSFFISQAARENGSKVVLAGTGGDEIFGGYNYYVKNSWEKKLSPFGIFSFLVPSRLSKNGAISKILRSISFSSRPILNFFYHRCLFGGEMVNGIEQRVEKLRNIGLSMQGNGRKKRMWCDLKTYLPEELLSLLDRVTMGNSIEGRVPLCDHRLVEALYSIEETVMFPRGERKGLMKKIAKKYLPESIYKLPKSGFNSPVHVWVNDSKNAEKIRQTLLGERALVKKLLGERLNPNSFETMNFYQKWAIFSLEVFLRVHMVEDRDNIVNLKSKKLWEILN